MDEKSPQRLSLPLSGESQPSEIHETQGADAPRSDAPLEERVIAALRTVFDPEIPVNIHELGLIYDLRVDPSGAVMIRMTLTSPACPVAGICLARCRRKCWPCPASRRQRSNWCGSRRGR